LLFISKNHKFVAYSAIFYFLKKFTTIYTTSITLMKEQ